MRKIFVFAILLVGFIGCNNDTQGDFDSNPIETDGGIDAEDLSLDTPDIPDPNILDKLDPKAGILANELLALDEALKIATEKYEIGSETRILDLPDPVAIARIALLAVQEASIPCNPKVVSHCQKPESAKQSLALYSNSKTYLQTVVQNTYEALDAWAQFALAKHSLKLINLFNALKDKGDLDIDSDLLLSWQTKATELTQTELSLEKKTLVKIDWNTIVPGGLKETLIGESIISHSPIVYPDQSLKSKAGALTKEVWDFVKATWGDRYPFYYETLAKMQSRCGNEKECKQNPLSPAPDPHSLGAQAVHALAFLKIAQSWTNGQQEMTAYFTGVDALVNKTQSWINKPEGKPEQGWNSYKDAANALSVQLNERRLVVAHNDTIEKIKDGFKETFPTSYDDPNSTDYKENVATRHAEDFDTHWWENWGPAMVLNISYAAATQDIVANPSSNVWVPYEAISMESVIPSFGFYIPDQEQTTAQESASSWPDAAPVTISWEVTTSAPLDHVDIRIFRTSDLTGTSTKEATPFRHFVEVANESGEFPFATQFNPLEDPDLVSAGPDVATYRTYVVKAVVVDKMGRHSSVSCRQIDVRYGMEPQSECDPGGLYFCPIDIALEPAPMIACFSDPMDDLLDSLGDYLDPNTIEIRHVEYSSGTTATIYRPYELVVNQLTGTLTMINNTPNQHHFKSVYTAPYKYDLNDPFLMDESIGNVAPLDFGVVNAMSTTTVAMPANVSQYYHWTLYDILDDSNYWKRIKIRVYVY